MICLTGDIHHSSLRTGNQMHADKPEVRIARELLEMLEGPGVKVTFFISGKTFEEEWADLEPIVGNVLVEVGGHNWSCFTPPLLHRVSRKVFGSYNGPRWQQRRDARRTIEVIRRRTGKTITVWRNHMYMHGPHTESVLRECGLEVCSDGVEKDSMGPKRHPSGLYNFPINVIPDHEHLYHAERTREWVAAWQKRYAWSDDFGPDSYEIDEWVDRVLEGLRRNEERGAVSNMIIHPITMYLCDGFRGFRRILEYLSGRETVHVTEAVRSAGVKT